MSKYSNAQYDLVKYKVITLYSTILFMSGIIYLGSFFIDSLKSFEFTVKLLAGIVLLAFSYILRASVNPYNTNDKKAIAVFSLLFVFIMSLSFSPTDPSKIGVIRYLGLLTLITIIPLYTTVKKAIIVFTVIVVLQALRLLLIFQYEIPIEIADNSRVWYVSMFSFCMIFLVWTVHTISTTYQKLIIEYMETNVLLENRKKQVLIRDHELKANIIKMAEIYDGDLAACEEYTKEAELRLKNTKNELKQFVKESALTLNKVDQHIRRINDLSYSAGDLRDD